MYSEMYFETYFYVKGIFEIFLKMIRCSDGM